ncbi:MAG: endonuclease MutS2 [Eubacteriales bacterium]|nr:endonuclease MutS2 [Eubacteriales bacterium]
MNQFNTQPQGLPVSEHTCRKLEFPIILERLMKYTITPPGREYAAGLTPATTLYEVDHALDEANEALSLLIQKGNISFGSDYDYLPLLSRLRLGAILSCAELLQIAKLLTLTASVKHYGGDNEDSILADYFASLTPLSPVKTAIEAAIVSADEVRDHASPTLHDIRRRMNAIHAQIQRQLTNFLNGGARNYLQDALVTTRGGRYCIPVKAEHRSAVPGMIHDQSSSGATLFIEPMAVVKLNNDLKSLQADEEEEITRILATLSEMTAAHLDEIEDDYRMIGYLDFVFAKGKLALEMKAFRPAVNTDGIIDIRQGRHPLLNPDTVVPINVSLGETYTLLVVTGPNTGGKTVSLKVVGLFTLMAQAGLLIPAGEGSRIALFSQIFADIGDHQSIEENLSTFSAHMTTIVSIMRMADAGSLVLFDELGSGTDPIEGSALAVSILDQLHQRGTTVMATTHYSELKVYALDTPGVENAGCEFDVDTLSPTYRLITGMPGKSNAFAISGRLGLPSEIIDDAKSRLTAQQENLEELLSKLEEKRLLLEKKEADIDILHRRAKEADSRLSERLQKIEDQKMRILEDAKQQALAMLADAKELADRTIADFHKYGQAAPSMKEMEAKRTALRQKMDSTKAKVTQQKTKPVVQTNGLSREQVHIGDKVKVLSAGLTGIITSKPDAKGMVFVQMGILKEKISLKDMILVPDEAAVGRLQKGSAKTNVGSMRFGKSMQVAPEINLLGKTVDEALPTLDKYLDDAYLAHLSPVRVVHGKGTGKLRQAIQKHLKRLPYVKRFRDGVFGEGDSGVTVVEFKEQ